MARKFLMNVQEFIDPLSIALLSVKVTNTRVLRIIQLHLSIENEPKVMSFIARLTGYKILLLNDREIERQILSEPQNFKMYLIRW